MKKLDLEKLAQAEDSYFHLSSHEQMASGGCLLHTAGRSVPWDAICIGYSYDEVRSAEKQIARLFVHGLGLRDTFDSTKYSRYIATLHFVYKHLEPDEIETALSFILYGMVIMHAEGNISEEEMCMALSPPGRCFRNLTQLGQFLLESTEFEYSFVVTKWENAIKIILKNDGRHISHSEFEERLSRLYTWIRSSTLFKGRRESGVASITEVCRHTTIELLDRFLEGRRGLFASRQTDFVSIFDLLVHCEEAWIDTQFRPLFRDKAVLAIQKGGFENVKLFLDSYNELRRCKQFSAVCKLPDMKLGFASLCSEADEKMKSACNISGRIKLANARGDQETINSLHLCIGELGILDSKDTPLRVNVVLT